MFIPQIFLSTQVVMCRGLDLNVQQSLATELFDSGPGIQN